MEIFRYLTLAGILFAIGVYGALTRRSFAGALLSLSISAGAIALAFVTFNRLIQPAETNGYFFGLVILIVSIVYCALAAQFVRRVDNPASSEDTSDTSHTVEELLREPTTHSQVSPTYTQMNFARRDGEGFVGVISFTDSFAFQVTVMIVFIVGYVLMRLSAPSAIAFLGGVGLLTHILHRRKNAERLKKKSPVTMTPIIRTKVSRL